MNETQKLYQQAKKIIPGGTQLLSKRPEMFLPEKWPAYYSRAEGCRVWDLDGNEYIDMSLMGIGACILGYAHESINSVVKNVVDMGNMTTLNAPEEVELGELLCEIHPWADMVRYSRTGGEAMSIAVRIARAKTKKDVVLFCGYHGWHDWYLSANISDDASLDNHLLPGLDSTGVPRNLGNTAIPFTYNDIESFRKVLRENEGRIAAVVMEPIRNYYPTKDFLKVIREETEKEGIVLVFDEITSGWRLNIGGAHLEFGVEPDIAVFGKGMSNGYPMSAIIGRSDVMQSAQNSFISSTYWTERVGPVASIETIKFMRENNIPSHLNEIGNMVQNGWKQIAEDLGLDISVFGIAPLSHFSFNYENALALKTLFTKLMLDRGYLAATGLYVSYAHKSEDIRKYLENVKTVFAEIKTAIENGNVESMIDGPISHSGFKRLT